MVNFGFKHKTLKKLLTWQKNNLDHWYNNMFFHSITSVEQVFTVMQNRGTENKINSYEVIIKSWHAMYK